VIGFLFCPYQWGPKPNIDEMISNRAKEMYIDYMAEQQVIRRIEDGK
jgi:hypothetical protein